MGYNNQIKMSKGGQPVDMWNSISVIIILRLSMVRPARIKSDSRDVLYSSTFSASIKGVT